MFQTKKTCSIFAAFLFCSLVLAACGDSGSEGPAPDAPANDSAPADSASEDSASLSITMWGKGAPSSSLYLSYPADSFLAKFEIGDIVTVAIVDHDTLEMPVVESVSNVPIAGFLVSAVEGADHLNLAIHYGQFTDVLGITDTSETIEVVVTLKEKGGFLFGLEMLYIQYMDGYKESYPDLTIDEFANFREVRTTGMGENKLYRSSSPIDNCLGRNIYADSLAEEAGVATFINLADTEEYANSYNGFETSYYSKQDVIFLGLPVEFYSTPFKEGLAKGFRYMTEHDAPYLVHCTYGMDRTGFTISVLEALMGATPEEIGADYAKTFSNYFNVIGGKQVALNEQQVDYFKSVVIKNLKSVYHAEGINISDIETTDLALATEEYLEKLGLSKSEVADLKNRLK